VRRTSGGPTSSSKGQSQRKLAAQSHGPSAGESDASVGRPMVARLPKGWAGEEPVRPRGSVPETGGHLLLIRGPAPPVTWGLALAPSTRPSAIAPFPPRQTRLDRSPHRRYGTPHASFFIVCALSRRAPCGGRPMVARLPKGWAGEEPVHPTTRTTSSSPDPGTGEGRLRGGLPYCFFLPTMWLLHGIARYA
jgi:hypothetical protein